MNWGPDYLGHIQGAVIMNLIIIGEAATKLLQEHPGFCARHADIPWQSMKGMRNRMAHGYFDINLAVVWSTVRDALPVLSRQVADIRRQGLV